MDGSAEGTCSEKSKSVSEAYLIHGNKFNNEKLRITVNLRSQPTGFCFLYVAIIQMIKKQIADGFTCLTPLWRICTSYTWKYSTFFSHFNSNMTHIIQKTYNCQFTRVYLC